MIRYSYVWRHERARGEEEGNARPCAVVLAAKLENDKTTVVVAPITRTPPTDPKSAVEIPPDTKRRLGLDHNRSWIITNDLNSFEWPGPDIRPIEGKGSFAYGYLPERLAKSVIYDVKALRRMGKVKATDRDAEPAPAKTDWGGQDKITGKEPFKPLLPRK